MAPVAETTELNRLRSALQTIRRKVHSHNRGGDLSPALRLEVRQICDDALGDDGNLRRQPAQQNREDC